MNYYNRRSRAESKMNIDVIKTTYELKGSKQAIENYFLFYPYLLDYKTENKLIRSMVTGNKAALENIIRDIQEQGKKEVLKTIGEFKKEYYKI